MRAALFHLVCIMHGGWPYWLQGGNSQLTSSGIDAPKESLSNSLSPDLSRVIVTAGDSPLSISIDSSWEVALSSSKVLLEGCPI